MSSKSKAAEIPLPKSGDAHVKSAILDIIALAQYALTYSRSWPPQGRSAACCRYSRPENADIFPPMSPRISPMVS
jgi:hypothetical protein